MARIKQIRRHSGGRATIVLDSGDRLSWPSPVVTESGLEEGDTVEKHELEEDLRDIAGELLSVKARKYLARYMRTTHQFIEHFTGKGYPRRQVLDLVEPLEEESYLDNRQVASEHLQKRMRNKPRGRQKLIAELLEKGIDRNQAREIVNNEVDEETEREMAYRYGEKNSGLSKRKLASRLSSRGFPAHITREVAEKFGKKHPD